MEILLALVVIAFAFPLMVLASPLLLYVVPLVVIGLVISYVVRGHEHEGRCVDPLQEVVDNELFLIFHGAACCVLEVLQVVAAA